MKITTQISYPHQNWQEREVIIEKICDLMPSFGAKYEKRISSIVYWRDDEPQTALKRLTEIISYDGKIDVSQKSKELVFNCRRQYPSWYIYVPMIPFVLVFPILWLYILPEFGFSVYYMIPLIFLFIILPILNYYYFAPYFFKNTMKKLLDEALA